MALFVTRAIKRAVRADKPGWPLNTARMASTKNVERLGSGRLKYRGETFGGFNKPKRTPSAKKKSAVLAKKGDEVKLVRFGDPNMSIKKDQPARRKSFRARHKCESAKDKFSARYWSCKAW